jgi:hypothetical protein
VVAWAREKKLGWGTLMKVGRDEAWTFKVEWTRENRPTFDAITSCMLQQQRPAVDTDRPEPIDFESFDTEAIDKLFENIDWEESKKR